MKKKIIIKNVCIQVQAFERICIHVCYSRVETATEVLQFIRRSVLVDKCIEE